VSWLQSGIRLIYRRYTLEWDIHEQITITQVTRARVKVKVNRRYISGWSLYPFQDRHHHARTVTLDRQTGKVIEAESHPFYRRLWLNPHVTIGDSIPISIRIKDPTELWFTVKGLDLKTVDMNHFNCWRFEASFQNEHYRIWYDDKDGLRIRFEALRRISQHQFSAHTVWQLQQIHMS
jgi:hypothetical protein